MRWVKLAPAAVASGLAAYILCKNLEGACRHLRHQSTMLLVTATTPETPADQFAEEAGADSPDQLLLGAASDGAATPMKLPGIRVRRADRI